MQTYKKVLLFLLITCFAGINEGWSQSVLHPFRRNKPGIYPTSEHFRSFHVRKIPFENQKPLSKIERKQNRKAERAKRKALQAQERGRKKHVNRQTPEVQERMKKSFEESEKIRGRKTFWERLMFWKKSKSKEKRISR